MKKAYRVKVPYGFYRKGDIIYPGGMMRESLKNFGYIEEANPEPVIETATFVAKRRAVRREDSRPIQ
jgi:hypothetical protein